MKVVATMMAIAKGRLELIAVFASISVAVDPPTKTCAPDGRALSRTACTRFCAAPDVSSRPVLSVMSWVPLTLRVVAFAVAALGWPLAKLPAELSARCTPGIALRVRA